MGSRERPHVVIIGGGFGGLDGARHARAGAGPHHAARPAQPPPVPAAALPGRDRGAEPERHRVSDPRGAREAARTRACCSPRRARSTSRRATVMLDDGALALRLPVVATGATHSYFGKDQWAQLAPGLKSVEDALEIRRRIFLAYEAAEREADPAAQREWLTFVVVGGGPTGVELAGALGEIGLHTLAKDFRAIDPTEVRVVLFEGQRPRARRVSAEAVRGREAARSRSATSRCALDTLVTAIDERGVTVKGPTARSASARAPCCGRPACRRRRSRASLGVPLDRAGRVDRRARPLDPRPSRGVRDRRSREDDHRRRARCPASRRARCRAARTSRSIIARARRAAARRSATATRATWRRSAAPRR